ncbi:MAG: type IV pilus assembly protein PilM [Deltaproteobacteria bacterium]|nr:type IV pilus assembly protein PilM [Deltaproteobacteria bacterium]
MAKVKIGLDIGSHSIKLTGFQMTSRGLFLTHAGIKEIPHGREEGDLNFIAEVTKALYREMDLPPGKVRLCVSGPGIHIRRITFPAMPKADLKEAIRWELKGQLSYPIESAQIDFHVLNEFVEDDSKKLNMIAVICPHQQIERTLAIAGKAGLHPTHLNVGPFALWNALLNFHGLEKEERVALIDLGAEKTGIHIFQKGVLQVSREFTPAGNDITLAIQEGIEPAPGLHSLFDRAERVKYTIGIPAKGPYEKIEGESISVAKITFLVRPVLERLVAEISRSLAYYRAQFPAERIDRVLLSGGCASLKNISSYLADELHLPVERFNPLQEIPFDTRLVQPQLLDEMGPALTAAAGAAFSQPKRIELLPVKDPFLSKIRQGETIPVLTALVIGLIFFWIGWDMNAELSQLKKEYEAKMIQMKTTEALPEKLGLLKERESQMKQDLSIFASAMVLPAQFQGVLRKLPILIPQNVTVTILSVQAKPQPAKEESPAKEGKELQITGLAFGSDLNCLTALAQMIEGLEKSPLFKNARLISADETNSYTRPGIRFEMTCELESEGQKGKP